MQRWREGLITVALLGLGAGILASAVSTMLWPSSSVLPLALLWLGMAVPVVLAFARSRPIGLLRLRPADVLYALVLGVALRIVAGWLVQSEGPTPFPSMTMIGGRLADDWWFSDLLAPTVAAPVVEELFFHGVLLVALYTVLRRAAGRLTAGLAAWLATVAVFVLAHAALGAISLSAVLSLSLLAATTGALVLLTGRIWGAVLVHVVFNATYVVLALVGLALA